MRGSPSRLPAPTVSLTSVGYTNAIADAREALKFKQGLYPQESEIVAEAHFKLSLRSSSPRSRNRLKTPPAVRRKPWTRNFRAEAATHLAGSH